MNQPVVTIVIPVYNAEKYLNRCIESAVKQSYKKLDIVLVDDGSTDESARICKRFAAEDSRVQYIRQNNKGLSSARNTGLKYAIGEFVSFVDSDDILCYTAIEAMLVAVQEDTDMVVGSYEKFRYGAGKKVLNSNCEFSHSDIREKIAELDGYIDFAWGKLFRCSVIRDNNLMYDEKIVYVEDHVYNIRFCLYARRINVIADVVYRYRLGGWLSSIKYHANIHQLNYEMLKAYEEFSGEERLVPRWYLQKKVRDQLFVTFMRYIGHCSYGEAIRKVAQTLDVYARYIDEDYIVSRLYPLDMRECILSGDPKRVVDCFIKHNWNRLVLKKIKLLCY